MPLLTPAYFQQSVDRLLEALPQCSENSPVVFCVGLSGGVDSVVLLHLLSQIQPRLSCPVTIKAIHVNHQLHEKANEWQKFCSSICQNLNIPFQCVEVDASIKKGEGSEAAARNARYNAFKKVLDTNELLLLGHHLDDQVETVFLQMLRGTGVDGAAGMKLISDFNGSYLLRPLLQFERSSIESYAAELKLSWINDPSNEETKYDRNFLRHEVLPKINERWPAYREMISRFSQHMRSASELVFDISKKDYSITSDDTQHSLIIEKLNKLSPERKNNVIRYWLKTRFSISPTTAQLYQLNKLIAAREDATPLVKIDNIEVRRFQHRLYLVDTDQHPELKAFSIKIDSWVLDESIFIPQVGYLTLKEKKGEGIKPHYFSSNNIAITLRKGGEKCHPADRNKSQSLKKVLQEKNIFPWRRNSLPLIYIDDEIACIFDEFYCKPFSIENKSEIGFVLVFNENE